MANNVLNVGAGFLPIVASDLGVDEVLNYDPLRYARNTGQLTEDQYKEYMNYVENFGILKYIVEQEPMSGDIMYCTKREDVDKKYGENSVDLVLGISPYGFSLVDTWVNGKLKPEGYVVAIGNNNNEWMYADKLFSDDLTGRYRASNSPEGWIQQIINKVFSDYPSHTSALERNTKNNMAMIYKKNT